MLHYWLRRVEGLIKIFTLMKELLWSYKIQVINAPTCNKGVLPFARTKVVRNGFTGKCKHHVNTYQRYDKPYTKSILEHDLSRVVRVASFSSSHSVS